MRFSRSLTVLASSTILATGAVVAVSAGTTTNPIKLCASVKTGFVSVPASNGSCPKGTSDTLVANDSDVRALAQRMDGVEAAGGALGTRVAALEGMHREHGSATFSMHATAEQLQQGPVERTFATPFDARVTVGCEDRPFEENPPWRDYVVVAERKLAPNDQPGDFQFGYEFLKLKDSRTMVFEMPGPTPDERAGLTVIAARDRDFSIGDCSIVVTLIW